MYSCYPFLLLIFLFIQTLPFPNEGTAISTKLRHSIGKSITLSLSSVKVARSTIDSSSKLTNSQITKKNSFIQSLIKPFTKGKARIHPIEAKQKYQNTEELLKIYREKLNSLSESSFAYHKNIEEGLKIYREKLISLAERRTGYYKSKGKSFDSSKLLKPISSSPSTSNRDQTNQIPRSKSMI